MSIFLFLYLLFYVIVLYNKGKEAFSMNLHITKSKNAESFYICRSFTKANGSTSSTIVRKLGTLENLLPEHGPTREDVIAWAKNEVRIETEKYKAEKDAKTVLIPFHADRQLNKHFSVVDIFSLSPFTINSR